ncbi:hypothetical protein GOP47_0021853 [Adiantum capillus-veneris]|uniref:DNA (cytosine-5-)-methyltransferase n=1 Tax=Adiantum capillus-veneris TaxID=13818 RepID=A0A9D4U876_ADICA|nr:hypothetical protein GOP47_0021853 [Adiantum capillus-veneris]
MEGLVDYENSSSSSSNSPDKKKFKRSPRTPHNESEVSSSVVQEDPNERTDEPTQSSALKLYEMGCDFEQILHAITLCGQETKVEDLFDFIQACKCSLEEEKNALGMRIHEENAWMQQTTEPCPSVRMHITDSCGFEEKEDLVMQTQRYTGEASCSKSPHIGDHSTSPLQALEAIGFSKAEVQRASDECSSIDFDVLLNFLLGKNKVEPCIDSFVPPEVDSYENMDCEPAIVSKLLKMGFPFVAIQKAFTLSGSHDFEVLLDVLNAFESLKNEREVAEAKESSHMKQGDESLGARLFDDISSSASEDSLSFRADVLGESVGASHFNSRISYGAESSLRCKPGLKWTGTMEKLWCSYLGSKKKMEFSPLSDSDDSEAEMFRPTLEGKTLKSKGSKRKLEFQAVDKVQSQVGRMMGYGIPGLFIGRPKPLPHLMHGPPYFYFENVAGVPNNEWDTIKRHFNGVDPEFTDSKFFSASRRPRGYVHNLPVEGRTPLSCPPPMTVSEAFPDTQRYWPSWDTREKLNCINTRKAPDSLCGLIRTLFALSDDGRELPYHRQQEIVQACKKWNLVWVGPGRVAPLEPHEMELLLGFDRDHTRGFSSMTDRYDALGNSFQVHTVAYHLSPLRYLYPHGVAVLSLFSGIGGAEVALDKLGVPLKVVIAVEINEKVREVLAGWWRKSGQTGELKLRTDVRDLTYDVLADLVDEVGPIDLIIGGSPCNNLSGNNRVSRVGLSGSESSLFFEFPRILNIVTQVMRDRGFL